MFQKKKIICIIPAREGSVGLKNKNIKKINGKPLIYWPINAAKKSKLIDTIIVSSDSKKVKKLAKNYNVACPFLRPKKISGHKAKELQKLNRNHKIETLSTCNGCVYLNADSSGVLIKSKTGNRGISR